MNEKLVNSLVEIISSLSEPERNLLNQKLLAKLQASEFNSENWQDEPFVGMWKDRQDIEESTAWVRSIRHQHWIGNAKNPD
ncbi:hypothetical protein [Lyngbya sp. PCC 8106]|uniref:hypothetical protein n=1 Tax=Lyngbya sp. (strain PCC 8106) TaxID=313612 RepID=UPI0000EA99C3|nr:hypothetical protein [Lyngbya sp. PCC 8106]EAW36867.1 hypothetical protein L8106_26937 [Lyngbya sp. PCC 8106]